MMVNRGWFPYLCLFAAIALLAAGLAQAGGWPALFALPLAGLVGWLIKRPATRGLRPALLLMVVGVAAAGGLTGASPALLIAGVALALVGWELDEQRQQQILSGADPRDSGPGRSITGLLLAAVGLGALLAEAGQLVHTRLPFAGLLLAGALVVFGLYRFYRLFNR